MRGIILVQIGDLGLGVSALLIFLRQAHRYLMDSAEHRQVIGNAHLINLCKIMSLNRDVESIRQRRQRPIMSFRETYSKNGGISGAHNCFIQLTVYWGFLAFGTLLAVMVAIFLSHPKNCSADPMGLCLLGISFSLLFFMMFIHQLYAKEFSLGLGLIVGSRLWIWPTGEVK